MSHSYVRMICDSRPARNPSVGAGCHRPTNLFTTPTLASVMARTPSTMLPLGTPLLLFLLVIFKVVTYLISLLPFT